MSKSEQKRICVQSECAVRDELRSRLDVKEKELQKYKDVAEAAKPFLSGDVVDETCGTIPLMEALEKALNQLEGGSDGS